MVEEEEHGVEDGGRRHAENGAHYARNLSADQQGENHQQRGKTNSLAEHLWRNHVYHDLLKHEQRYRYDHDFSQRTLQ